MNTIEQYITYAEDHSQFTRDQNPEKANETYDKLVCVYKKIKEEDPKLELLKPLLNHQNDAVRVAAASHLIADYKEDALQTLKEIRGKETYEALSAKMLIEIAEGKWQ